MPLLAAEAELGVLLVPLRGRAVATAGTLAGALPVGALDLVFDGDVEIDGFPLARGRTGLGAFCYVCVRYCKLKRS